MPESHPTDKSAGLSAPPTTSAALSSSFNKTLSALTGTKNLGGAGGGLTVGGKLGAASGGSGGNPPGNPTAPQPEAQAPPTATIPVPVHNATHSHARQSTSGAPAASADDVITVTETLIDAIGRGDYDTWKKMTSHDLTCFEPESQGCLVEGREFHKYYFDLGIYEKLKPFRVNVIAPRVHLLGPDAGVIGYVLLTQFTEPKTGAPVSRQCEESRVWRRDRDGLWRCVHFHRSSFVHPGQASTPTLPVTTT